MSALRITNGLAVWPVERLGVGWCFLAEVLTDDEHYALAPRCPGPHGEIYAAIDTGWRREPVRVTCGPLHVDARIPVATLRGEPLDLCRKEFELLAFLASHPHRVFSRQDLLLEVWGNAHQGEETVTEHVRRLRSKIEDDSHHPRWIITVRTFGYRFEHPG